jgi:CIC family chloride channel protein
VPDIMGVGYDYVEKVLNGDVVLKTVVLLAVLKVLATTMCYSSGNAGGIFGPSLFIGAMMGATVGGVAHHFFPASTAGPGAYALVGMGTAFAGIVRTPLTSVIMIFEITRDYSIIVPLMISNLIAYYISHKLQPEPIYEALAHQDGVHLPISDRVISEKSRVAWVMRPAAGAFSPETSVADALAWMKRESVDAWPVVNGSGLSGVVRRAQLESGGGAAVSDVFQPAEHEFPHVHPDHSLSVALERIGASGLQIIPVVSRANATDLIGVAVLNDILRAYGVNR